MDYTGQSADNAVTRTDFLEQDRLRLRGAYEAAKWLRISATAEQVDTSNEDTGYGYDGTMKTYAGTSRSPRGSGSASGSARDASRETAASRTATRRPG